MSKENQTLLDVEGMSCPSCVSHIKEVLRRVDGVNRVEVRFSEGRVLVGHEDSARLQNLVGAVRDAGYRARAVAADCGPAG